MNQQCQSAPEVKAIRSATVVQQQYSGFYLEPQASPVLKSEVHTVSGVLQFDTPPHLQCGHEEWKCAPSSAGQGLSVVAKCYQQ